MEASNQIVFNYSVSCFYLDKQILLLKYKKKRTDTAQLARILGVILFPFSIYLILFLFSCKFRESITHRMVGFMVLLLCT